MRCAKLCSLHPDLYIIDYIPLNLDIVSKMVGNLSAPLKVTAGLFTTTASGLVGACPLTSM